MYKCQDELRYGSTVGITSESTPETTSEHFSELSRPGAPSRIMRMYKCQDVLRSGGTVGITSESTPEKASEYFSAIARRASRMASHLASCTSPIADWKSVRLYLKPASTTSYLQEPSLRYRFQASRSMPCKRIKRIRFAASALSVVTIPPSPVVSVLVA